MNFIIVSLLLGFAGGIFLWEGWALVHILIYGSVTFVEPNIQILLWEIVSMFGASILCFHQVYKLAKERVKVDD